MSIDKTKKNITIAIFVNKYSNNIMKEWSRLNIISTKKEHMY